MPVSKPYSWQRMTATSPGRRSVRPRYPLQVGIAVIFTLLISVLGVTLVWFNYTENKRMTLLAADDLFARITRQTTTNIHKLYAPAEAVVDMSAQLGTVEAETLEGRNGLLRYFAESLRSAKTLSSLYIGYADGEFFQVWNLEGHPEISGVIGAPDAAHFAVRSIEIGSQGPRQTKLYYDKDLELIGASKPSATDYDPRSRVWYRSAAQVPHQIGSDFYVFRTPPVAGTTIARRTRTGKAVIGADLTLRELSRGIVKERVTPSTEILVFNGAGTVLAYPGASRVARTDGLDAQTGLRQTHMTELGNPAFDYLYGSVQSGKGPGALTLSIAGREWMGSVPRLPVRSGNEVYLAILVPQDELLAGINALRDKSVLISLFLLLLAVAVAWWISRRVSQSLRKLASEAERIRELKLDTPITARSRFLEVDELAGTMAVMKSSIQQFIEISKSLSAEQDFERLLENILSEARTVCKADGGSLLLFDEENQRIDCAVALNERTGMHYGGTQGKAVPFPPLQLGDGEKRAVSLVLERQTIVSGQTLVIGDITTDDRFDYRELRQRYEGNDYRCRSVLHLPLRNRQQEIIGVLELINARDPGAGEPGPFKPEAVSYVEAMSAQAAIALDNRRLLKAQKQLMDAFIQLIAGAIDAKSPYTSGHCQRVPELARMLAEAAQESDAEPFRGFELSDEEWYELHIASWLHDCGKVTTPEYVVDKATKLECIYNRIHEIRMRFEVLWRDAQIAYYKALAEGNQDRHELQRQLDAQFTQLQEDYAFVAECNLGGEFMAPERVERLEQLGARVWLRHFDDRLGLSQDEMARKQRSQAWELPAQERLLANKPEHIVPRHAGENPIDDNPHGFQMDVPEYAFNYGELYNLSIARGTLTAEDRFKINEHIIQTIILLNKLPFPRELRRVPTWAGNHHEKLDGSGYPRRLSAENLSVPERIMAIADIFEALTASDRPYKKAKTLSESIRIMSFMRKDGHICPDLFKLFLTSGVYREYAVMFLAPEQIDEIDVGQLVG